MKTKKPKNEKSLLLGGIFSLCLAGGFFIFHFFDLPFSASHPISLSFAALENLTSPLSPESLPAASQLVLGQKIDLNHASAKDLEALPEIGPKLAEKIVKTRQKMGSFRKIEDLMRVSGIKEKKFARLKNFVEVK